MVVFSSTGSLLRRWITLPVVGSLLGVWTHSPSWVFGEVGCGLWVWFGPLNFICQLGGTRHPLLFSESLFSQVKIENDDRVHFLGSGHSALCVVCIKHLVNCQLWMFFWKSPAGLPSQSQAPLAAGNQHLLLCFLSWSSVPAFPCLEATNMPTLLAPCSLSSPFLSPTSEA